MKRPDSLNGALRRLRYSNTKGMVIPMHHAFRTLKFSFATQATVLLLPMALMLGVWLMLPLISVFWGEVFEFWMTRLFPGGEKVAYHGMSVLGMQVRMPYPDVSAAPPSSAIVIGNAVACIVLLALTLLIPQRLAPLSYLARAALIIQLSASVYFLFVPDAFPYGLANYVTDALSMGQALLLLVPPILALIYYIFDFALWRKLWLTLLIMGFFIIAYPFQFMLHAYIVHQGSYIMLPLLYFLFGTLMDVMMFISLYAYGLSWKRKGATDFGRYA